MPDSGYVMEAQQEPRGELASRVLAMPTDTKPKGDIFGGWIMSLMDMAGKMSATTVADCRVVTVAVLRRFPTVFHRFRPFSISDAIWNHSTIQGVDLKCRFPRR